MAQENGRVILAEPVNKFSPDSASEFGKIHYLLDERINPFDIDKTLSVLYSCLTEIEYDPCKDMIVMTGQASCALLLMVAQEFWGDAEILVLLFDARYGNYKCRSAKVWGLE